MKLPALLQTPESVYRRAEGGRVAQGFAEPGRMNGTDPGRKRKGFFPYDLFDAGAEEGFASGKYAPYNNSVRVDYVDEKGEERPSTKALFSMILRAFSSPFSALMQTSPPEILSP